MSRRILMLTAVLATGCGDGMPWIEPFVDVPAPQSEADPLAAVDELEISIAHAGADDDLALTRAPAGEPLELDGVPYADDLVVHLRGFQRGDEIAYGRTCVFAAQPGEPVPQPHLYFARIVKWGDTASPVEPMRRFPTAVSLPDGSALFTGGSLEVRGAERFEPVSGAFVALPGQLLPRAGGALARFPNGRVALLGGADADGNAVATMEILDPIGGVEPQTESGLALLDPVATPLVDGNVLIAGGRLQPAPGQPAVVTASAWSLRVGDGGTVEPPRRIADMNRARTGHTLTRLGDDVGAAVLVVGGVDDNGDPVEEVELYRPQRERFEPVAGASLVRWGHRAVALPGDFVLIVGGYTVDVGLGTPVPAVDLALYDPVQGVFVTESMGRLPTGAGVTEISTTRLPDGRVLIAGGRTVSGEVTAQAFIARLDPVSGEVNILFTDDLATPRAGQTAVLLCDGTVLLVGGTDDAAAPGAERYQPPATARR